MEWINKESFMLYLEGLWIMRWMLFPFVLGFTLCGLYEAVERKWDEKERGIYK